MTTHQRAVLDYMTLKNIGAILFEGSYRFPVHFREDAFLAERFSRAILGN